MTLQLVSAAFHQGLRDVDQAAERLRHDRDVVARRVDALLDGGWSGAAATAFATAYDEWGRGARDVLDGLTAMGGLLRAAQAGLHGSDAAAAARLQEVSARVIDRLGR